MYEAVIEFWFHEIEPLQWWQKDREFDLLIERRFGDLHTQAKAGELDAWRKTPLGSLAEIIVLDQFSRNIFRGEAASFAYDSMSLVLAQCAIEKEFDLQLENAERAFMYMPFMHSESQRIHLTAVELFQSLGLESNLKFEYEHKAIIDQFGRYPHRNTILGRESTHEELEFLQQPNSGF